jgi:signal transduction histidine kinase
VDELAIGGDQPAGEVGDWPAPALRNGACLPKGAPAIPPAGPPSVRASALQRRHISHDIHHELGTITLLAALLSNARDVGPDSRARAELILQELNWLDQLHQAYEDTQRVPADGNWSDPAGTRLDLIASEVAGAIGLSCTTRVELRAEQLTARVEPLAYWRTLRNLLQNAVRAAGPSGTVAVRLTGEPGWAVTEVDDDGPGFTAVPSGPRSLGLAIVQDLVIAAGGSMEVRRSGLGGGCVRLRLPAARAQEGRTATGLVA